MIHFSAYDVQFVGPIADNRWTQVWQTKAENKCRFFMWLLLQCSWLPTADRIIQRGGTAGPVCKLCHIRQETTVHMVAQCSYAQSVWRLLAQRTSFTLPQSSSHLSSVREWREQITKATGIDSVHLLQILTYATWNIWKECCRRVFDNKALPVDQLVMLIQHDVAAYRQAHAV
jgi:hypothetical protein